MVSPETPAWVQWIIGIIVALCGTLAAIAGGLIRSVSKKIEGFHNENHKAIESVEARFDAALQEVRRAKETENARLWEEIRRMNERWFERAQEMSNRVMAEIRDSEKRTIETITQLLARGR